MATGPEHYREAERLIDLGDRASHAREHERAVRRYAVAQVHATLALATNGEGAATQRRMRANYETTIDAYNELCAAVREHLIARDTPPYMDEMTVARLRDLVGDALPVSDYPDVDQER